MKIYENKKMFLYLKKNIILTLEWFFIYITFEKHIGGIKRVYIKIIIKIKKKIIKLKGTSMEPTLKSNQLIILNKLYSYFGKPYKVGDVICCIDPT